MRTTKKTALSVAGLAVVGIGGSVAWAQMKRMPQRDAAVAAMLPVAVLLLPESPAHVG